MALASECGEQMLSSHPELRGGALTIAWRSSLQEIPARLVPTLIERGAPADAEAMDTAMRRPPQQAAERLAVIRLLLMADAPVDAEDFDGLTPLHRAAREGDSELVALLLSFGADRERTTREGITPLQLAQAQGAEEAVALLQHQELSAHISTSTTNGTLHQAGEPEALRPEPRQLQRSAEAAANFGHPHFRKFIPHADARNKRRPGRSQSAKRRMRCGPWAG